MPSTLFCLNKLSTSSPSAFLFTCKRIISQVLFLLSKYLFYCPCLGHKPSELFKVYNLVCVALCFITETNFDYQTIRSYGNTRKSQWHDIFCFSGRMAWIKNWDIPCFL